MPGVSVWKGQPGGGGGGEFIDKFVDMFHAVVAFLIIVIDGAFCMEDVLESQVSAAGAVFFMPKEKVVHMIGFDEAEQTSVHWGGFLLVPVVSELSLKFGYGAYVNLFHNKLCWIF